MGKFLKLNGKTTNVESPVGDFEWVIVSGQGKLNTLKKPDAAGNKPYEYQATLLMPADNEDCIAFQEEIMQYWEDTRSKKFAKADPKSCGFKPHKVKTDKIDPDTEEAIWEEDGLIAFTFKTNTVYGDGKPKVITIFNAKGREVQLGKRRIGQGSRGRVKGVITPYEQPKEAGVSLYLNGLQLSKFVEYVGGTSFDELEDPDAEGDGFEGFDEDGQDALEEADKETAEEAPVKSKGKAGKGQPRL
jgi:hypothetical protein